ncbi:MAG: SGNH/GDSL hydrolase family protein [Verrucomicrobiota bacterium]
MNFRTLLLTMCALAGAITMAVAAEPTPKEMAKAKRDAMMAPVKDVPGLPRVLLLGDSISMGYTVKVRELLAGKANVHRPPENCFESGNGLKKLDAWLGTGKWDVIHFNFGLHDNKYVDEKGTLTTTAKGKVVTTPAQYEKNIREFVARAKKTGATLIYATTTPVPAKSNGRVEASEIAYNTAGSNVMREAGVTVNDLHAFVTGHKDAQQLPNGNVHFTEKGYAQLAEVVAAKIEAALAKRK